MKTIVALIGRASKSKVRVARLLPNPTKRILREIEGFAG